MRTPVVALLFLGITAGCNHPDRVPRGILSKDSMQSIMWDIIQADQYASQYLARDSVKSNIKPQTIRLYQQIFDLHGITREEFEKSYQFYPRPSRYCQDHAGQFVRPGAAPPVGSL